MSAPEQPDPADIVLGHATAEEITPGDLSLEAALLPLHGADEATPSDALWAAISDRIDAAEDVPGTHTVPPEAGVWETLFPGVERKIVFQDRATEQAGYYLRMEAGAVLPGHVHDHHEHCVVLSGQLQLGRDSFGPGTYHFAARGHDHPPIRAEAASVVFIFGGL